LPLGDGLPAGGRLGLALAGGRVVLGGRGSVRAGGRLGLEPDPQPDE
jgi:hypothetical protein